MTRSHAFEEISRVGLARDVKAALFTCMVHLIRFRLKNPGVLDDFATVPPMGLCQVRSLVR